MIVIFPITIVIYSTLIFVFLFDKKIDFVIPATSIIEIIIPLMLVFFFAMQFSLYHKSMKQRREEIENLRNQIVKYEFKINKMKINEQIIKRELGEQLNLRDYNYSVVKLSFLIENELQRLIKKYKVNREKSMSIGIMAEFLSKKNKFPKEFVPLLISINKIRNKAVHGVKITKYELDSYVKVSEIALNILKKLK